MPTQDAVAYMDSTRPSRLESARSGSLDATLNAHVGLDRFSGGKRFAALLTFIDVSSSPADRVRT